MKRSYVSYLMLVLVFLMAVVASCEKEGPAGPAGKDGLMELTVKMELMVQMAQLPVSSATMIHRLTLQKQISGRIQHMQLVEIMKEITVNVQFATQARDF